MFTADEIRNIVHRTRAVEGDHSDDIFEDSWLQLLQIAFHTRAFKLENTSGMSVLEEFECEFIIDRNFLNVDYFVSCFTDNTESVLNNGEVT